MRNVKLEEIIRELTCFVAQSGTDYEAFNPLTHGIGDIYNALFVTGLFPSTKTKTCKCNASSERFRTLGNQAFVSKNDMSALHLYTKAIGSAIPDGEVMCLAYGNRSAVTFALGEYCDAVKDIDRALRGHYPDHLKYKLVERRGKCYLALSEHDKARDDFKQLKSLISKSNLDQDKMDLLNTHADVLLEKCSESASADPKKDIKLPQLTHDPSPYIQCASSAVDIKFTPKMGRHIVAATDIFPGNVIAIEKPYASVLLPPSYTLFCDFCKKRCHSSIPCSYCCDTMFCDEVCREKSWSSHHAIECDVLPSLIAMGCDKMELLAVRVLLMATDCGKHLQQLVDICDTETPDEPVKKKGFLNNMYKSDVYCSTHNLETNSESRSVEDLFRRGTIAACIIFVLIELTEFFEIPDSPLRKNSLYRNFSVPTNLSVVHVVAGDLILRHLMSAPCNAHEIAEMRIWPIGNDLETESTEIGGAIYPFHSLINHSCDPNVVRHAFNGDTVVLSSIQLIKKGQQIFDNYGYHHAVHSVSTRQQHLKSQYYFSCECPACINNWPLYHDLPDGTPCYMTAGCEKKVQESSEKFTNILSEIKNGKTSDENFEFLTNHLTLLHQHVQRPWKEYNLCQEAIKQCLSLKANHYVFRKKP